MIENKITIENKIIFKGKKAFFDDEQLGISGENEQKKLVFCFEDDFIDGDAILEVEFPSRTKRYILSKQKR